MLNELPYSCPAVLLNCCPLVRPPRLLAVWRLARYVLAKDLEGVIRRLGQQVTPDEVTQMVAAMDEERSGTDLVSPALAHEIWPLPSRAHGRCLPGHMPVGGTVAPRARPSHRLPTGWRAGKIHYQEYLHMASTTIKENAKLFPTGTVIFREVAPAGRPASTTTRCLPRRGTTRPADPPMSAPPSS